MSEKKRGIFDSMYDSKINATTNYMAEESQRGRRGK